jgi:two-component system, cell cycle sensor histidine kinase and response regulator CckA
MGKPLRALIVEDSENDAELLVRSLEDASYSVVHERVQTADGMKAALARAQWDVVLSDCSMPGFSAVAALEVLQAAGHDLPFIIVSGTIGEEAAVVALKAGAHDFLIKGRPARLGPAIERELREAIHRSEQRETEEALRVSEGQYRSLVEHAVFGLFRSTADGRFLTVNPALVRMLGYDSPEELLEIDIASLSVESDTLGRPPDGSEAHNRWTGTETVWRRKTGEAMRVRLAGHVSEERHEGQPVLDVIVEDVTEEFRLQEQLRRTQQMEALGQLAGGVAHDFNNLLTAILGYAELVSDQIGPDKPIAADLEQIRGAARRAVALTKQLLAFSRKQVLAISQVNITEVIRAMEPMLGRLLGAPIAVRTDLYEDVHPVMADATQLEHLLINLAVNARDAMPQGGALTIVTRNAELDPAYANTHPGAKPGTYAALSVTDSGVGMTAEVQEKIFEPFFTTKERGRGTGLGLAAVYGAVKQLGGYIEVQSQPAQGSTFTIYLPGKAPPVPEQRGAVAGSSDSHETILLVEVDTTARAVVNAMLRTSGYRVLEADSAEAALAVLERSEERIDLLLSDLILPGMNGHELAVRITRDRPHVRALLMSGYAAQLGALQNLLEPGVLLLEKPFSRDTLLKKTREALAGGGAPSASQQ